MAESATLNVEANGYRNVIIRGTLVSDGSGVSSQTIYNATSSGAYGVNKGGQLFYPGVHTTIVGLDFDVDGMRFKLTWDATPTPQDILTFGASPESFRWESFGGIRVPSGLVGATGSILLSTIAAAANATLSFILYLRKNVPQS
jgi:hypothetical protein